ncbi:MAG: hypothetical protein ACFFAS_02200 [Promethearchaeota archaeon]
MIGEYKGKVKNKVITALLTAYHEILDYDGLKSILNEANMLHLKNIKDINTEESMDFFSFKKIVSAQNVLLFESNLLLRLIGEKFSFYLFPFGKDFEEIIKEINELINTDWKVTITNKTPEEIKISVQKCVFCSEIGVSCDLFKGFLIHSLEKTLQSGMKIAIVEEKENILDPNHSSFKLILKIQKNG